MTKRKFWWLGAILIATMHVSDAQEFSLGIKLGASYPSTQNFDFANEDGLDGLGIHGGVMAEYKMGPFAGIAEALYDYNEFSGQVNGFDTDYYYTRIVLPIAFKYYVDSGFNLQLGAKIGVLLTAESQATVELQSEPRYDISLTTSNTDLGAFFGFGYDSPIGLTFSLRYHAGITDFPTAGDRLSGPSLAIGYHVFHYGGQRSGLPGIKGKKYKRGRTRSGR